MSYEPNVDISEKVWPSSQVWTEIYWLETRIRELQAKLLYKPSTIREINDLKRQIADKHKVLDFRSTIR